MRPRATVLYEDQQPAGAPRYAPHDLVVAMVGDRLGRPTWELYGQLEGIPRKGVDKIIADISGATAQFAGAGRLCVLVDQDRIAEKLGLPRHVVPEQVVRSLKVLSDAPEKLEVFLLQPNMEGLLASIAACGGPAIPRRKDLNERDKVLNKVTYALPISVRQCVEGKQPGLKDLAELLARLCAPTPPSEGSV